MVERALSKDFDAADSTRKVTQRKRNIYGTYQKADQAVARHGQQAHPIVQVGKNDLSENAIKQADDIIERRELIKGSVLDGSGLTAKEAGEGLAEQLDAELVQVIGNRFVIYRRSQRDDVEHIRLVRE